MSYNQIDWRHSQRTSTDSSLNRSSVRMSTDSYMRPSTDDLQAMQAVVDALHLRMSKLTEINSRIRKQINRFESLNEKQRKEVRLMVPEAMKLAEGVQDGLKNVRNEDQKMKFENMLDKQAKELSFLGDSLMFKEKEVLMTYKEKLEISKMDKNPALLEKRALLEETDSEDEEDRAFARDIEQRGAQRRRQGRAAAQQQEYEESKDHILNLEESREQELLQEEFKMEGTADFVKMRDSKIQRVAKSLGHVHKMYKNLNDLVNQQGVTLNRINDNVVDSKMNSKATLKDMKRALKNEGTFKEKLASGDCSIVCLAIWFGIVAIMFYFDMQVSPTKQSHLH